MKRFLAGRDSYARQREILSNIIGRLRPRRVACLGAGVLNDIPLAELVETGASLTLVDWLPGAIDAGLSLSIVYGETPDDPACIFCQLDADKAQAYCHKFDRNGPAKRGVCKNYRPSTTGPPTCTAYQRGLRPRICEEDITGGYATAFAAGVAKTVAGTGSWRQALRDALGLARKADAYREEINIPQGSIDLVTSSLVLSQFEHEPYTYFSRQVADKIGPPTRSEEKRLGPSLEKLRDTLLQGQVARHCQEINRLLAPGGFCLLGIELFHFNSKLGKWFRVAEMHRILETVSEYFDFNCDALPDTDSVVRFEQATGISQVYYFMLQVKTRTS